MGIGAQCRPYDAAAGCSDTAEWLCPGSRRRPSTGPRGEGMAFFQTMPGETIAQSFTLRYDGSGCSVDGKIIGTIDLKYHMYGTDTGTLRVGLSRLDDRIRFSAAMPATPGAVSAVLVLRDMRREPDLYDPTLDGHFPAPAGAEWADWTPPDYARALVWASGRGTAAEQAALSAGGTGLVFHFPESAVDAIIARDPRETARIELIDGHGDTVGHYYFEIGDFGAARAFVRSGNLTVPRS